MKKNVIMVVFLMMLLPIASAEIFVSQPESVYNIGDGFAFNVTLMPSTFTNNFFIAKIVCVENSSSGEIEIYRSPQSISGGKTKNIDVSGKFDNYLVGTLRGNCYLRAEYGKDIANSGEFEITNNININAGTDRAVLDPGERFTLSGNAIKSNGKSLANGFVEIKSDELGISSFRALEGGSFSIPLDIADDSASGEYDIHARVYEKDEQGDVTNEGEGVARIRVNQIIKKSSIAISSQDVTPGTDFIFTVLLFDQTEKEVSENVRVLIREPDGELFLDRLLKSGDAKNLTIEKNFMPGEWTISATINNISASREFNVEELEEITYTLDNQTLIAKNTGNVPYKKAIEVLIGNQTKVLEIEANPGEVKRYALYAPNGEYPIEIIDGENTNMLGTALLTGNAVGVEREGEFHFWRSSYLIIWIMIISLAVLFAFSQYGRISKRAYVGTTPANYEAPIKLATVPTVQNKSNVITDGARQECSIIALKIKNLEDIEKMKGSALDAIERALTRARDARAKIYSDRNYKTMVFSPSITNELDNSMKAVSIAREIENTLLEHNKRFGEKVMFGIGVHNGEMIVENINGQFKFNAIGNTMPYAKKIADTINSGTAVSEHVHRKILGKVKSDKVEGTNYWRIGKIRDRELHSEFINRFMQRQKREFGR